MHREFAKLEPAHEMLTDYGLEPRQIEVFFGRRYTLIYHVQFWRQKNVLFVCESGKWYYALPNGYKSGTKELLLDVIHEFKDKYLEHYGQMNGQPALI